MTPSQASFAAGALGLAVFVLLNLLVLRLPGRMAPVTRQALLGLLVHGLATLLAAWLVPGVTYWHGAALYWLGFNGCLFGFSAVYKSVSLRILGELAARRDGMLPLADIVETHVRPCFTERVTLLLEAGLTCEQAGRFALTARGAKTAVRCGRVQRCFGIKRSGLYTQDSDEGDQVPRRRAPSGSSAAVVTRPAPDSCCDCNTNSGGQPVSRLLAARAWVQRNGVLVLFVGSLLLVGAIFARGVELRMHEAVHARLIRYAFPSAISTMYHGTPLYVIQSEVVDRAIKAPAFGNAVLRETVAMPLQDPAQTRLFPADDKGLVDVVLLAFLLFGPNVEGLFFTTVLILLITVLAFFVDLRGSAPRCVAPLFILGGIYAAMPALPLTGELGSFTNPRLFELLGLIPVLHLALAMLDGGGFSWTRLAALALQVLVIVECVHVRCSALWLVFAVIVLYALVLVARIARAVSRRRLFDPELASILRAAWVPALVLAGVAGLKGYQQFAYPPEYLSTHLQHRILWHNVGIGFALHPEFAGTYNLRIDDSSMAGLTMKRVSDRKDFERYAAIWGPVESYASAVDGWAKDYQAYDEEAQGMVLDMARMHPRETFELFCYYKPRLALRTVGWVAGFRRFDIHRLHLDDQAASLPAPEEMTARGLHVRLDWLLGFAVALLLVCRACGIRARSLARQGGVFALLAVGSFVPAACTYPVLHVIGVGILTLASFVLFLGVLTLVAAADWLAVRLRPAQARADGQPEASAGPAQRSLAA